MRGRKPIPTPVHRLAGTFDPSRHGKNRAAEPIAVGDLDGAPSWMTADQRASWNYAIQHAPAGLLKQIDYGVLAVWVVAEDEHRIATMKLAEHDVTAAWPLLTVDKDGLPKASPYLGVINRAALRMMKAGSELGFSPAARPRLSVPNAPDAAAPVSPWDAFDVIDGGKAQA